MKALLLKDMRVNRLVLVVGMVFLLGPPIVGILVNLYSSWRYGILTRAWPEMLIYSAATSLTLSLLTVAMLGGNAVAGERADRSAEFLAYLPPSRMTVITSKALVALGFGIFIWLVNLAIVYGVAPAVGEIEEAMHYFRGRAVPILATTSVLLLGVGWLASSMLPSPATATGIAFGPPWLLFAVLSIIKFHLDYSDLPVAEWYYALATMLGILSFFGGALYYLRRLEP